MSAGSSSRLSSAFILGGRIVLLLAAAGAVIAALVLQRSHADGASAVATAGALTYACPMHPEVVGVAATVCPICGMALEPVRPRPRNGGPAQSVSVQETGQSRLFYDVMFAKTRTIAREMLAPASIDADGGLTAVFYNDELALLDPREVGTFRASGGAGRAPVAVRVATDPAVPRDRATSAVRFVVTGASSPGTTAGDVGWIKLPARSRQMLAVPASAIVQSPAGPYVLVASVDRRTFSRRPVQIGRVLFGYAAVLGGLRGGERIVAMNTFFIDAERRWGTRAGGASEEPAP